MSEVVTAVLTDTSARDKERLASVLAQKAEEFIPWGS